MEVGSDYMSSYISLDSDMYSATSTGTFTWGGSWDTSDYVYMDANTLTTDQITPYTSIVKEIIKEKVVTKEVEKRTLYKVFVVDPRKQGKILVEKAVIAINENQAMLKAGVAEAADGAELELEQVDVYVQLIGTFIRPRKETQRVKISKEED